MQAIRHSWLSETTFTSQAFADDFDVIAASSETAADRDDDTWADVPLPVSVTLPLEADIACEVVIPAHYEPRYAYPLLIWIQPDGDVSFRDRISAISDRNYIGMAVHWGGFAWRPMAAIPRVAECHGLMQCALGMLGSLWHTHPGRRYLVAEGAVACEWARRLARHAPHTVDAIACLHPGAWPAPIRETFSLPGPGKRLLVISDETDVLDNWRKRAASLGWTIETAPGEQQAGQMARRIDAWLMTRLAGG